MNRKKDKIRGRNFDQKPLTFGEFLDCYNNFFLNFCLEDPSIARNYYLLVKVDKALADELSTVHMRFIKKPSQSNLLILISYPVWVFEQGYKAYLLLREHFKDDPELQNRIAEYRGQSTNSMALLREYFKDNSEALQEIEIHRLKTDTVILPDDWPAFFS
ncbi:MAG: hypothetical protein WCJ45_05235 [bacterium]